MEQRNQAIARLEFPLAAFEFDVIEPAVVVVGLDAVVAVPTEEAGVLDAEEPVSDKYGLPESAARRLLGRRESLNL